MRSGILSDDYTKENFPAFFDQPFRKGRIRKPGIPYYDLYATAQVTMDNVYVGASELVENYVSPVANVVANVPQLAVTPESPKTNIFEMNLEEMQNIITNNTSWNISPPHQPDFGNPFANYGNQVADQYGTMQPLEVPEAPPRSLPTLRPDFGYNPSN